jgi:protein arginine kinase activator
LIRLRREMAEAVTQEDYERASELRDQIRRIEISET